MMNWPFETIDEFRSHTNPLDWYPTTGKKQHNKKKYTLYWSPKFGGVWVNA